LLKAAAMVQMTPVADGLEAVLVEVSAGQHKFHTPKQEKVRRHKVLKKGGVLNMPNVVRDEPLLYSRGRMNRSICGKAGMGRQD
jgi:hypothetical protein